MPNTVTNEKIISATYVALFQRSPDQAGFKYWSDKAAELQLAGKTGNDLAKEMANLFALHPAFTGLYGALGDAAYIDAIYTNIGGKVADTSGRAFWLSKLTDATNPLSRAELVGEFVYTILSITPAELQEQKDAGSITEQELADALARQDRLNNKSDVALKFTQTMGLGSNLSPGTDPDSLESLQQDPVYLASKAIINGVTEDDDTMAAPNAYLDGTPTIKGINETFGDGANDGKTFMLTENVDAGAAFTGGAGNDLFIATDKLVGVAGSVQTWTAADQIDGGAGTNTFQVTSSVGAIANPAGATVKNIQIMKVVAADVNVDLNTTDFGLTSLTVNSSGNGTGTFDVTAAATTDITWAAVEQGGTTVTTQGGNNVTVTATKVDGAGGVSVTDAAGNVVISSTGAAYVASTAATLGDIAVDGGKTISVTQVATSDASKAAKDAGAAAVTQGDVTITAGDDTTSITVKQDADVGVRSYSAGKTAVFGQATVTFSALDANDSITVAGLTFTAGAESLSAEEVAAAFANLSADAIEPTDSAGVEADGDTQGSANHKKGVFTGSIDGYTTGAASGDKVVFTVTSVVADVTAANVALALEATFGGTAALAAGAAVGKTASVLGADAATGRMGIVTGEVAITGSASLETVTVDGYGAGAADGITGTTNTALATLNLANGTDFDVESAATTLALNANNVQGTVDIQSGTTTLNAEVKGNTAGARDTDLASVTVKTLAITGDGKVSGDVAGLVAVETIDTTGFTGTATFEINGEQTAYTGGAGVDNVDVTATSGSKIVSQALGAGNDTLDLGGLTGGNILALATGVVFDGGADTDTVILSAAAAEAVSLSKNDATTFLAHITNFENVQIDALGANQTVNLGNLGYSTATVLGADPAAASSTLTLRDAVDGTAVTLRDADIDGIEVRVKGATSTKLAAGVSLEIAHTGNIDAGTFTASNVDTITLVATDTDVTATNPVDAAHKVELAAAQATSVVVNGNADSLDLVLNATTVALTEIDATDFAGGLTVNLGADAGFDDPNAAIAGQAVTVYGGKGDDFLRASNDEADELFGGAGDDTLIAGANSSVLQGGAGNDLYIANVVGNNAFDADGTTPYDGTNPLGSITFSTILGFGTGADLLQLLSNVVGGAGLAEVTAFDKVQTGISQADGKLMDNITAAIVAADNGAAVWFSYQGSSYVVIDNDDTGGFADGAGDIFSNGNDVVIKLAGVDLTNASFNSDFGTIAL